MKNQDNLILILSVCYGATLILVGILILNFRNEIQRWVDYSNTLESGWNNATEGWDVTMQEMIERGNKILELINSMNILKNQNVKYSKICRKLYNENYNLKYDNKHLEEKCKNRSLEIEELKLKNQGLESLFVDMKNKANEFELKIAELEKGKFKKRVRKKL